MPLVIRVAAARRGRCLKACLKLFSVYAMTHFQHECAAGSRPIHADPIAVRSRIGARTAPVKLQPGPLASGREKPDGRNFWPKVRNRYFFLRQEQLIIGSVTVYGSIFYYDDVGRFPPNLPLFLKFSYG